MKRKGGGWRGRNEKRIDGRRWEKKKKGTYIFLIALFFQNFVYKEYIFLFSLDYIKEYYFQFKISKKKKKDRQ